MFLWFVAESRRGSNLVLCTTREAGVRNAPIDGHAQVPRRCGAVQCFRPASGPPNPSSGCTCSRAIHFLSESSTASSASEDTAQSSSSKVVKNKIPIRTGFEKEFGVPVPHLTKTYNLSATIRTPYFQRNNLTPPLLPHRLTSGGMTVGSAYDTPRRCRH